VTQEADLHLTQTLQLVPNAFKHTDLTHELIEQASLAQQNGVTDDAEVMADIQHVFGQQVRIEVCYSGHVCIFVLLHIDKPQLSYMVNMVHTMLRYKKKLSVRACVR